MKIKFVIPSLILFLSSNLTTFYFQKKSHNMRNENKPLPDILHSDKYLNLCKYYRLTNIPINIYIFLLIFKFNSNMHIFFIIMSIIYYIRALSFSSTILPKCGKMEDKDNNRSCVRILLDYVTLKDQHIGHNNDLLPSGHVCFSFLFNLYVYHYKYLNYKKSVFLFIINFINSLFIILTRCHYTIDVFYAYLLTYVIFIKINPLLSRLVCRV